MSDPTVKTLTAMASITLKHFRATGFRHYFGENKKMLRTRQAGKIALLMTMLCLLVGCGGGGDPTCDDAQTPPSVDCDTSGNCPEISLTGDSPAPNPGVFHGFADPALGHDPNVHGRIWLAYSWPHIVDGHALDGKPVKMAAVSTHLARSDDGGQIFNFVDTLWPEYSLADPEGSGETGFISSETASLATMKDGARTTWYGAHLRYFLEPRTGYFPKYGTSMHIRIGAAASPQDLATADEAVLGVSTTASTYSPDVRLDQLAGLPIQHCAILNNPALYTENRTLYLIVECLAFVGNKQDFPNHSIQVFATEPMGGPSTWGWRYAGVLADHDLAVELGTDSLQQPDVSKGPNGKPIAIFTPAVIDSSVHVGTVGTGCVAIELESIDPPSLARDCNGNLKIQAEASGTGLGACTYCTESETGMVITRKASADGNWTIHATQIMR